MVGSKKVLIPQSASPAIVISGVRSLAIQRGAAALIRFGYCSASACVIKPPSELPQATTFVVFGYCFLKTPISSTFVLIAESAFQP